MLPCWKQKSKSNFIISCFYSDFCKGHLIWRHEISLTQNPHQESWLNVLRELSGLGLKATIANTASWAFHYTRPQCMNIGEFTWILIRSLLDSVWLPLALTWVLQIMSGQVMEDTEVNGNGSGCTETEPYGFAKLPDTIMPHIHTLSGMEDSWP